MSGGLTEKHLSWAQDFTRVNINGNAGAPGTGPSGGLSMRAPAKGPAINLMPTSLPSNPAADNAAAAKTEAEAWVRKYFGDGKLMRDPTPFAAEGSVIFNGKSALLRDVAKAALTAGKTADLKSGDSGRALIDAALVVRIAKDVLGIKKAAKPAGDADKPKGQGDDDDGPEVSLEVSAITGQADTQIQYTVKLHASNDASPPKVQYFPDVEITFHTAGAGSAPSLEAQLNIIKADIGTMLHLPGKIKVEASVGVGAEMNIKDAAMGDLVKSVEVKLKAELSVGLTKHLSIKPGLEMGSDGKPSGGVGVVWKF